MRSREVPSGTILEDLAVSNRERTVLNSVSYSHGLRYPSAASPHRNRNLAEVK